MHYPEEETSTSHPDYLDPDEQEYDSEGSNCIFSRDFFLLKKQDKNGIFHTWLVNWLHQLGKKFAKEIISLIFGEMRNNF